MTGPEEGRREERDGRERRPRPGAFGPSGFVALRIPLLPFDDLLRWGEGLVSPAAGRTAEAVASDRALQRRRLREAVARPEVREALFLASPDLVDAIPRWEASPESAAGRRAERGLVKYFCRMAGRATPFGLMAGTAIGRVGEETHLVHEGARGAARRSRLDTDFLFDLAEAIAADRRLREGLLLWPNTTLHETAGRFRWIEARRDGKERSHHLVSLEAEPPHRETVARAGAGATAGALAAPLIAEGATPDEATAFVDELVDAQLLVPDSGLVITGAEPATAMAERLGESPAAGKAAAALRETCRELDRLDAEGIGADPARYREIAGRLAGLPATPDLARLFQVDLEIRTPEAVVGRAVLEEVRRAVELLWRVAEPGSGPLDAFRLAFAERYGGREVPLVEALDEESGIGFPPGAGDGTERAPLLRGLALPAGLSPAPARTGEAHLLRRLLAAAEGGETEIVLDREDLERLASIGPAPLPPAFSAVVQVAAESDEALAAGRFRVLVEAVGGPSGVALLGRFCHRNPALLGLVRAHLEKEEALEGDAVVAEVVHLPEGRIGNVLLRPLLRGWEIPFGGRSGAPPERQIPPSDLLVSVHDGSVLLRSRRLGRRVVPRLTTAHNYSSYGLALYRFLGALQEQGVAPGLAWRWGGLAASPFLPRVRAGRAVLARATWTVDREEMEGLRKGSEAERLQAVDAWRRRRRLPRHVVLAEGDNGLPVDLDAPLSVDAFLHAADKGEAVCLTELFPGPDELALHGPGGRYVHQLVIPFVRGAPAAPRVPPALPAGPAAAIPPLFLPGSEWLTAKVYAGAATAERVLREQLAPAAASAVAAGAVDRWFFLRYADPDPHVRLRLHGEPRRLCGEVLPALDRVLAPLVAAGRVRKVQIDPYAPETERYGGPEGTERAEEIFAADSAAVVALLEMLEDGDEGDEERWRLALLGTDALLGDLGFAGGEKDAIVAREADALARELPGGRALRRLCGERFRREGRELGRLLEEEGDALAPGREVLSERSRRIASPCAALREMHRRGTLARPLDEVAASLLHMHLNRLFRSAHRLQELAVHDLLARVYRSRRGRHGEAG